MPDGPAPIFTDNPGSLPATYTIPPGVQIDLSSVYAKIDGSGAAASFLPCLTVLSQDGHVIARVKQDDSYAVGDTGDATWSPFLKAAAAAAPPSGGYPFTLDRAGLQGMSVLVPTATWTALDGNWSSSYNVGSQAYIRSNTGPNRLQFTLPPVFTLSGIIEWSAAFAADRWLRVGPSGFVDPGTDDFLYFYLGNAGSSTAWATTIVISAGTVGVFTDLTFEVWQNSGVNQTCTGDCTTEMILVGI